MRNLIAALALCALGFSTEGGGQQATIQTDPVFLRAQQLVNDGEVAKGRALVDSVINATTPGTPEYGEALYWRAVLAATSDAAESDYKQILVEYSMSPRVEDVLLRLSQLEYTRGDRDGALRHLQRLTLDYPEGTHRARAGYWLARVLFDRNEVAKACAANSEAAAKLGTNDIELKNQIEYQSKRCLALANVASSTVVPDTAKRDTAKQDSARIADSARVKADTSMVARTESTSVSSETKSTTKGKKGAAKKTERRQDSAGAKGDSKAGTSKKSGGKSDSSAKKRGDSADEKAKTSSGAGKQDTEVTATTAVPTTAPSGGFYSIQLGAYADRRGAQGLVNRLKTHGYDLRIDGDGPFRVRLGEYPKHADAAKVLKTLKAKQIKGFIVQVEAR
jgi:cell division protein FtsN